MDPSTRFATDSYRSLFDDIAGVREHRESFLSEIEQGKVSLQGVFDAAGQDPVLAGMKVLPAIEGLPNTGKVQTRRAFEDVGIDEADHIGPVTNEAIAGLPAALEKHAR